MTHTALILWNAELKARKLHRGCALEELCNHVFPFIRAGQFSYPPEVCVSFIGDFASQTSPREDAVQGSCLELGSGSNVIRVALDEVIEVHDSTVLSRTPVGNFVMAPGRLLPLKGRTEKGEMILALNKIGVGRTAVSFCSLQIKESE